MTALAPNAWDDALTQAFAILLGKPLEDYDADATYGTYYVCPDLSLDLFDRDFDVAPLARGEIVRPPFPSMPILGRLFEGWDRIAPHWTIDLGNSIFYAEDSGHGVDGLESGLPGVELGRILIERGMKPSDLSKASPLVAFRVHSDGSLLDAMRVITGTMRGPEHLTPLESMYGVEDRWRNRLAAVEHAGLRDHLLDLCRDADSARCDGALYVEDDENPGCGIPPYPVIAAWEFGEGQAWSAVVRLPTGPGRPEADPTP
ncbi:hypothetical protein DP939_28500 [Spongiactinospora rosea]|uniref:Uncharacterized protein n=1 Tax=Spongiactinospora rosea TaxID=2248750 RepID=A0A366LSB2_9ACTN|nr:hypothetical protein [Spongiactinospora rosea]RBQ16637.1 hypothetical protein DP939_28500 [Spongiactinospora rosea]